MSLVSLLYASTAALPSTEKFGLISQIRRSAVSIPANIAEGRSRETRREFRRFLIQAFASGAELETHLAIVSRLRLGKMDELDRAEKLLNEIMRILNVMIRRLKYPPRTERSIS